MGVGKSECRSRSREAGEPTQGTPRSKERHRVREPLEGKMAETQTSVDISTKLERVAKLAREAPAMAFRNLAHFIDIDWLREAYRRTRKDGARGVDGQSAEAARPLRAYRRGRRTWDVRPARLHALLEQSALRQVGR